MDAILPIIITGAPGTGKSTIINELLRRGIPCIPETSRSIIQHQQENNGTSLPWEDVQTFVDLCFEQTQHDLQYFRHARYSDRSMLDHIVYLKKNNLTIPEKLLSFPYKKFYHTTVIYTPLWEAIYQTDPQRPEAFHEHVETDAILRELYINYGFQLIELPLGSIDERISYLIDQFH